MDSNNDAPATSGMAAPVPPISRNEAKRLIQAVADHFAMPLSDLLAQDRVPRVVRARGVAAYLLREMNFSLPAIGAVLHRDHTTIHHQLRRVQAMVAGGDEAFMRDIQAIRRAFTIGQSEMDAAKLQIEALHAQVRDLTGQLEALRADVALLMRVQGRETP